MIENERPCLSSIDRCLRAQKVNTQPRARGWVPGPLLQGLLNPRATTDLGLPALPWQGSASFGVGVCGGPSTVQPGKVPAVFLQHKSCLGLVNTAVRLHQALGSLHLPSCSASTGPTCCPACSSTPLDALPLLLTIICVPGWVLTLMRREVTLLLLVHADVCWPGSS